VNVATPRTKGRAGLSDLPAGPHDEPAASEPRQTSAFTLRIELVEDAGDWSAFGDGAALATLIQNAADAVARAGPDALRIPGPGRLAEAVVALSSDTEVAALNGQYRGKKKPTNVLSFPAPERAAQDFGDDEAPLALGDIIVAAETVLIEAADMGIMPADHLRHLIVHGLLHLLGYDHQEAGEADEMEALETHILATLGVADPYAGSEPADVPS